VYHSYDYLACQSLSSYIREIGHNGLPASMYRDGLPTNKHRSCE
jgi:hypothetical protein